MENEKKTITMEFDIAPFKKAVTDILLQEVKNHVYASRDSYTQAYDVRGFINDIWKEIDLEAIRKEVKGEIQHNRTNDCEQDADGNRNRRQGCDEQCQHP